MVVSLMGIIICGLHQLDFSSDVVPQTTSGAVKLGRCLPSWTADGAHGMLDEITACYATATGRLIEMRKCLEVICIIVACALQHWLRQSYCVQAKRSHIKEQF